MLKETRDYLRSKFRLGSSSSSSSQSADFDNITTTSSQSQDVNVDDAAQQGLKSLSRSVQMKSHDISVPLTHPDPNIAPTMLKRYADDFGDGDDEYIDQVIDQLTESPELISNNDRFQDEHLATLSDIYSDDDEDYDHGVGSFVPQVLEDLFGRSGRTSTTATAATTRDSRNPNAPSLETPVVYRYYSRNRARDVADGSIPFIFLGPNVDHWKVAGQELAARGFSVMAVERVRDEPGNSLPPYSTNGNDTDEQSDYFSSRGPGSDANVILRLLDALKWHKVVLVGCDSESALAIRAAMELAPDRIVGLVLCGNLQTADDFVANIYPQNRRLPGSFAVDRFLQSNLRCPFQIVWDGDVPKMPYFSGSGSDAASSEPLQTSHRSLVLGGGSAPHRRRPELFAWILTRFVEEKIAPTQVSRFKVPRTRSRGGQQSLVVGQQAPKPIYAPKHPLLLSLSEFLSPGSSVVWGRVVASALFYSTILKIALFHYERVRGGIININTGIEMVASLRKQILGAVTSFLGSVGTLSFLSRGRDKSRDDTEVEPQGTEHLSSSKEEEAEETDEEEQSRVPPPSSEDEGEQASTPAPSTEDEKEEESSADSTENMEKEEGPAKAPDFNPSFFLDHVIV